MPILEIKNPETNINGNKGEGVENSFTNEFSQGVNFNTNYNTSDYGTSLVFNNNFYREDSQELVDAIKFLEDNVKNKQLKFLAVDKINNKKLKYSAIAICQNIENKVYFFLVTLASTGREALTAQEYFNTELNARSKNSENTEAFTYFDNNNRELVKLAMSSIKKEYGETNVNYCDNIVLRTPINNISTVNRLEFLVNNLFIQARSEKNNGIFLKDITDKIGNTHEFVFDVTPSETDKDDNLGNIYRCDFQAEIKLQPKHNKLPDGSPIVDAVLVKVGGYIAPQPTVIVEEMNGYRQNVNTMSPNIIITDIETQYSDISNNLLAIIVAAMMTQENNWKLILSNKASELKIGALNKLLCLYQNNEGVYAEIDIDAGETVNGISYREQIIEQFFKGVPLVTFDITPYNYNTNTHFFTLLENRYATSEEMRNAALACDQEFDLGIKKLLGLEFGYSGDKILSRTVIPYGYIENSKGERRDIRKLTLCEVLSASKIGETTPINVMMETLRPNNQNAFNAWIELLKNHYPTAIIEGKTHRITFTNKFLNLLFKGFQKAINNNIRNKNTYVAPRKFDMGQDYNMFAQEAINIYGVNQNNANGFNYNFNQFNTQAYDGGKFM